MTKSKSGAGDDAFDGLVVALTSSIAQDAAAALQAKLGIRVQSDKQRLPAGTRAVLLLDPKLRLPDRFASVLRRAMDTLNSSGPVAFSGNHAPDLDPLAGLDLDSVDPDRAVGWASEGCSEAVLSPSPGCLLLPVNETGQFDRAPARAVLVDDGYVIDPERPLPSAEAEDPATPLLGHLGLRVGGLASEGLPDLPDPAWLSRGTTLHVTHGWGGGVWRWIEDFALADTDRIHLVLVANSDGPGRVCGRYLSLCVAGPGRGVVRELPLSPRILAVSGKHPGYAAQLAAIIERFAVDQVIVSSPIGHSLDCLTTGLPTAMVLHDFFPLWPLLDRDPMPFLEAAKGDPDQARADALTPHDEERRLHPVEAEFWNGLAIDWMRAVSERGVRLVAPTRHVIKRWRAIAGSPELAIEQIPHGFRPFASGSVRKPARRARGSRLHLLVPGRLTEGKGLSLLRRALPELSKIARVTALGCGRSGLSLMGVSGVDLVPEYRRDRLPALVRELAPDAALFCSTVPETWNYALSEVRALNLAPIATAVGSFPERIRDGVDGWLFEPTPEALVECVRRLAKNRKALRAAANAAPPERTLDQMASDFEQLLDGTAKSLQWASFQPMSTDGAVSARRAGLAARARQQAAAAAVALDSTQQELEQRSRWAETMERQFRSRSAGVESLRTELDRARAVLNSLREQFDERTEWSKSLDRDLAKAHQAYEELQSQFDDRTEWSKSLDRDLTKARKSYAKLQKQLEDRTEWSKSLDRDLTKARKSYAKLQKQLEDRTEWSKSLDRELANARKAYEELQSQFDDRTEWSKSLDRELANARKAYEELQSQFDDRTEWSKSLDRDLTKARKSYAKLQKQLEDRTEWSKSLDRELANARKAYEELQSQFDDRTEWSKSLDRELANARKAYEELQSQFDDRTEWSKSLDRDLTKARKAYDELQGQFDDRTEWSKQLDRDLDKTRIAYARLQEQFDERTEWSKRLDRDLGRAREAYALLQEQVEERTEWASRLDAELAQARDHLTDLHSEFEQRTAWALQLQMEKQELENFLVGEIDRVRSDYEHERQEREGVESKLHDVTVKLRDLSQEQERTRGELDSAHLVLEQTERQRAELEARVTEIMHSRSWRMTRPVRVVKRLCTRRRLMRLLNPLRWPGMVALLVHHLRLRGLRQTLELLQDAPVAVPEPATVLPVVTPSVERLADPVTMVPVDEPEISVVIPVYNQLHYTAHCLESLVSVDNRVAFETIVVDDCSTDDTRKWLKRCQGIKVVRNRRNLGFIGTCNRGARAARGRWIVFLNNDTRVTDGWLDALVKTFEQQPDAGVVGGRLVFANGTLQEAGGIVFRDGSGWNFGRGDDPDRPEYSFASEADYVSGACLAIPRALFKELGGFDRHYAPAYYEDTDLCFKVRQRGLKVIYQPASTVIHFEGGTSGTDENAGVKRHQVINRERFQARWAEALADYPENPQQHSAALAQKYRYRRWPQRALVIDATTPTPDQDSGSVRMFALLKLLGELGFRTSFMPDNLSWAGRNSADIQQLGVEVLTAPWLTDPEDWLAEHGTEIDLLIVSRHYILAPRLKLLRSLCPNAKLVFDTVDLHFLREEREAELAGSESARKAARATRRQELDLVQSSDATLVVSEFERELLGELTPEAEVGVVSNIHSLQNPGRGYEERRDLVFVGGFQHPPNIDAAEWLIDEILPRIRRELPEVELHLIGSKMPESLAQRRASGLRIHGFVADLEPYMTGCRVSVAPLRYGAGVKGKVNQAMSHGLPVVATSCAAEGMHTEHGVDVLMADDADGFAREVVRVYRDPKLWQTLALGGRANVERHFSVDAARSAVADVLGRLGLDSSAD